MNEMYHKCGKIVIFSKQYKVLKSMALVFTFDIPEIASPGTKVILEYVLKLKKFNFSSF